MRTTPLPSSESSHSQRAYDQLTALRTDLYAYAASYYDQHQRRSDCQRYRPFFDTGLPEQVPDLLAVFPRDWTALGLVPAERKAVDDRSIYCLPKTFHWVSWFGPSDRLLTSVLVVARLDEMIVAVRALLDAERSMPVAPSTLSSLQPPQTRGRTVSEFTSIIARPSAAQRDYAAWAGETLEQIEEELKDYGKRAVDSYSSKPAWEKFQNSLKEKSSALDEAIAPMKVLHRSLTARLSEAHRVKVKQEVIGMHQRALPVLEGAHGLEALEVLKAILDSDKAKGYREDYKQRVLGNLVFKQGDSSDEEKTESFSSEEDRLAYDTVEWLSQDDYRFAKQLLLGLALKQSSGAVDLSDASHQAVLRSTGAGDQDSQIECVKAVAQAWRGHLIDSLKESEIKTDFAAAAEPDAPQAMSEQLKAFRSRLAQGLTEFAKAKYKKSKKTKESWSTLLSLDHLRELSSNQALLKQLSQLNLSMGNVTGRSDDAPVALEANAAVKEQLVAGLQALYQIDLMIEALKALEQQQPSDVFAIHAHFVALVSRVGALHSTGALPPFSSDASSSSAGTVARPTRRSRLMRGVSFSSSPSKDPWVEQVETVLSDPRLSKIQTQLGNLISKVQDAADDGGLAAAEEEEQETLELPFDRALSAIQAARSADALAAAFKTLDVLGGRYHQNQSQITARIAQDKAAILDQITRLPRDTMVENDGMALKRLQKELETVTRLNRLSDIPALKMEALEKLRQAIAVPPQSRQLRSVLAQDAEGKFLRGEALTIDYVLQCFALIDRMEAEYQALNVNPAAMPHFIQMKRDFVVSVLDRLRSNEDITQRQFILIGVHPIVGGVEQEFAIDKRYDALFALEPSEKGRLVDALNSNNTDQICEIIKTHLQAMDEFQQFVLRIDAEVYREWLPERYQSVITLQERVSPERFYLEKDAVVAKMLVDSSCATSEIVQAVADNAEIGGLFYLQLRKDGHIPNLPDRTQAAVALRFKELERRLQTLTAGPVLPSDDSRLFSGCVAILQKRLAALDEIRVAMSDLSEAGIQPQEGSPLSDLLEREQYATKEQAIYKAVLMPLHDKQRSVIINNVLKEFKVKSLTLGDQCYGTEPKPVTPVDALHEENPQDPLVQTSQRAGALLDSKKFSAFNRLWGKTTALNTKRELGAQKSQSLLNVLSYFLSLYNSGATNSASEALNFLTLVTADTLNKQSEAWTDLNPELQQAIDSSSDEESDDAEIGCGVRNHRENGWFCFWQAGTTGGKTLQDLKALREEVDREANPDQHQGCMAWLTSCFGG